MYIHGTNYILINNKIVGLYYNNELYAVSLRPTVIMFRTNDLISSGSNETTKESKFIKKGMNGHWSPNRAVTPFVR